MEFVKIAPGGFEIGCSGGDKECSDSEKPAHRVEITKLFEMGKYEVTQAQWESIMGNNPSNFKGADRPVENVVWNDVQEFFRKLNARGDGFRYRLPTEAEWEYSARAGTTGPYAGSLAGMTWYVENSEHQTHPVGKKQPNVWGLYDMQGNVYEWVQDWFENYSNTSVTDPEGASSGRFRVMRGGSWSVGSRYSRVSSRARHVPNGKYGDLGFRAARERIR